MMAGQQHPALQDVEEQVEIEENDYDRDNSSSDEVPSAVLGGDEESGNLVPIDWANLPAHACSYCGIAHPSFVVKCNVSHCQRWFCNAQVNDAYFAMWNLSDRNYWVSYSESFG